MSTPNPSPMKTPNLAGLLKRPPTPPKDTSPQAMQPKAASTVDEPDRIDVAAKAAPTKQATSRSRSRSRTSEPPPAQAAAPAREYLRSVMVYLPRSLHQQLRARAEEEQTTATALMLTAVNATHTRLGQLLTRVETTGHRTHPGDLFAVPQGRTTAEPRVQTTIRVTDAQFQALNDLTAQHHVNRSKLIVTAVGEWLRP